MQDAGRVRPATRFCPAREMFLSYNVNRPAASHRPPLHYTINYDIESLGCLPLHRLKINVVNNVRFFDNALLNANTEKEWWRASRIPGQIDRSVLLQSTKKKFLGVFSLLGNNIEYSFSGSSREGHEVPIITLTASRPLNASANQLDIFQFAANRNWLFLLPHRLWMPMCLL